MDLICSSAGLCLNGRSDEDVRLDIIHVLGTLKRFRAPPAADGLVDPAIRFVESAAWPTIYLRLRCVRGWPKSEVSARSLTSLDESLKQQFFPIEEEFTSVDHGLEGFGPKG